MSTVLCFGEVLWDVFPGSRQLGGAPLNVAYHAAQLGCRADIVSAVGRDEAGAMARQKIEAAGVGHRLLATLSDRPTGEARVQLDAAGHARFEIVEDVAWDRIPHPGEIAPADAVVFGTLALRGAHNRGVLQELLDRAAGARIVWDLNLRPPFDQLDALEALLKRAQVIKMNDHEAALLAGPCKPEEQARRVRQRWGAETVCITLGREGALLLVEDTVLRCPSPPTQVVDTVGAGDAFTAGLVTGIVARRRDPDWAGALRLGTALGSYVAGCAGAQPPHRGFVRPPLEA